MISGRLRQICCALFLVSIQPVSLHLIRSRPIDAQLRRTVRVLLNTENSGTNAWLLLADSRGYFRYEGIDVQFTSGRGAYTTATRMVQDSFDFGIGDINGLIEESSIRPETAPVGVFMLFNRSPAAFIVKQGSPITTPRQLQGKKIIGQATDVALNTYDAVAATIPLTEATVISTKDSSRWETLLATLDDGRADALFGEITIGMGTLESSGIDPASTYRFMAYRDMAPDLYGSAILASRAMVDTDAVIVRAFVRAANRGLAASVADPDAAIAELVRRDPTLRTEVERNRLQRMLHGDMGAAEGSRIGIGDVDAKRMTTAIRMVHDACRLPRTPTWNEIFSRDFLPPLLDRVRTLGAPPP